MGIGVSIFLIAVGLILALAVNVTASGVDIVTIGWILVIVGAVGLLLSLIFWSSVGTWGPWRRETYVRDRLIEQDAAWRDWFAATGAGALVVEYERFAEDHTATLRDVLAHLGLEVERIPDPPKDRQGDARSDRWVARFNEEKELV